MCSLMWDWNNPSMMKVCTLIKQSACLHRCMSVSTRALMPHTVWYMSCDVWGPHWYHIRRKKIKKTNRSIGHKCRSFIRALLIDFPVGNLTLMKWVGTNIHGPVITLTPSHPQPLRCGGGRGLLGRENCLWGGQEERLLVVMVVVCSRGFRHVGCVWRCCLVTVVETRWRDKQRGDQCMRSACPESNTHTHTNATMINTSMLAWLSRETRLPPHTCTNTSSLATSQKGQRRIFENSTTSKKNLQSVHLPLDSCKVTPTDFFTFPNKSLDDVHFGFFFAHFININIIGTLSQSDLCGWSSFTSVCERGSLEWPCHSVTATGACYEKQALPCPFQ